MSFGKQLRKLRSDKEITQLQLSEILNTAKSNISKYEADTIEPNISMLCKLANYFNVSTDYLLGLSDTKLPYGIPSNFCEKTRSNPKIGNSINYWISKTGYGNDELAEKLGIKEELLDDYRSGYVEPPLEILQALSKICAVSTDCLLGIRENSRRQHNGEFPFRFDPEISRRLKEQAQQMDESYSFIADILGIDEYEVEHFFEYGFVPHISVFVQIVEHFLVSSDYLLNRTNCTMTPRSEEEKILCLFRSLNSEYKDIANGELTKLKKQQEQEEYIKRSTAVAASVDFKTGTDNLGKL